MKVALRADASILMGNGHVMRCLTLADSLKQSGAECHFLCREHPGHLIELIRDKGYSVHTLPYEQLGSVEQNGSTHAAWLGSTQKEDAQFCQPILQALKPDWLVVDHYSLDASWEGEMRFLCGRLMIIDDLADRTHQCDVLLDQNLGRQSIDYAELVPRECSIMIGPKFALLRPEFPALREYSLNRRVQPKLQNILITMGGVDQHNAAGRVLSALKQCRLPDCLRISVVLGPKAPWLKPVQAIAANMPWNTEVIVNASDMAQRMADCDLAIGAAGSTSWERCCMGVPTLMAVLANNQVAIAEALALSGAAILIGAPKDVGFEEQCALEVAKLVQVDSRLLAMSNAAASITSGTGTDTVTRRLLNQ